MANTQDKKKTNSVSLGDTAEIKIKRTTASSNTSVKKPVKQTNRATNTQAANAKKPPQAKKITEAPQPQRKASSQSPKKKKSNSADAKAKVFLFIMLVALAAFVAVICILGANGNNGLLPGGDTTLTNESSAIYNSTNAQDIPVQGNVSNGEAERPETQEAKPSFNNPATVTDCNFATVVVNRNYRIPQSYEDTLTLTYVCGSNERLQIDAAVQYVNMYNAAFEDGIYLTPCSGYRSYETQVGLYNNKVNTFLSQGYSEDEAKIQAATIVMVPGSSEHNLGYAIDIVCVEEWFENTPEFAWLMENAEDYGFILRYPKDKQDITKVIYEPWHWRYVGVDAAKKINASGLTLEEYYGKSAQ